MKLSPKAVQEFIEIYQREFGVILAYEKAEMMARELLQLYALIIE